jgi:hypothetical protein
MALLPFLDRYRRVVKDGKLPLPRKVPAVVDPGVLKACCDTVVALLKVASDDLQVGRR